MKKQLSLKYFLTIIICLQFTITPIFTLAAATTTTAPATETESSNLVKSFDETKENESHDDENFIMSGMLMLTMPVVAVISIKSLANTQAGTCYSPWIFGASAAYYAVMEVMNWEEFEGGSTGALEIVRDIHVDVQIETLTAAKEETARARKAVEAKADNAKIAGIGFGVAAAVAIAEQIMDTSTWSQGCRAEDKGSSTKDDPKAKATTKPKPVKPVKSVKPITNGKTSHIIDSETRCYDSTFSYESENTMKENKLKFQKKMANIFSIKPHTPQVVSNSLPAGNALENFAVYLQKNNTERSLTTDEYEKLNNPTIISLLPSAKQMAHWLQNALIPSAEGAMSSFEQYGIIGGTAAAALLYYLVESETMSLPTILSNGWTRAIMYGASAAIAFMAKSDFDEVVEHLKTREEQYASLIERLEQNNALSSLDLGGTTSSLNPAKAPVINPPKKPTVDADDLCIAGEDGEAVPISCDRCTVENNCKTSEIPESTQFPANIPQDLGTTTNLLQGMQTDRYSGNTAGADLASGQLGQYAGSVRNIKKKLEDVANANLIKKGKAPIDFDGMTKKFMNDYKGSALSAIKKMPAEHRSAYSSVAGLGGAVEKVKSHAKAKLNLPTQANGKAPSGKKTAKDPFAGIDFGQKPTAVGVKPVAHQNPIEDGYDYSTNVNDIIQSKNTNIFEIITVRYLKSAYPMLLEEEK